jgi:hypothetical protein
MESTWFSKKSVELLLLSFNFQHGSWCFVCSTSIVGRVLIRLWDLGCSLHEHKIKTILRIKIPFKII